MCFNIYNQPMVANCVSTHTSGEQTLEHSEHIQAVNNDGRVRVVKEFMKLVKTVLLVT